MPTVTLSPTSADGTLNGATEVTLVGPPSSGVNRLVRWIDVHNSDDMDIDLWIFMANGANRRVIFRSTLNSGDTFQLDSNDVIPLDSNRSIVAKISGPANSQEPDWTSGWADQTIA